MLNVISNVFYMYLVISYKNTPVSTEISQELFYWNIYPIIYLP